MIAQADLPTVLMIDDERGPRESIRMLLKGTHHVVCAESVDQGLALMGKEKPDLVIIDIRMPTKDGIAGLREIRGLDPGVSVIILTGHGTLETARQALRLGADDYVGKPFDAQEMRALVDRYVERSRLERRRQGMLHELSDVNERLVKDLADKEFLASLGQSSAEFAHDLRNPLMIVSGYVTLLSEQIEKANGLMSGESSQVREYLDVIEQNVRRCCELSQMWQRLGHSETQFSATPVVDVLSTLTVAAEPLASSHHVRIDYEYAANGTLIEANSAQLIRAFYNVVANAVQAVERDSGQVRVCCWHSDTELLLTVADNGRGMPKAVLDRLFEPYFTTKGEYRGTGLGMAIAKRIVSEHGGDITVQSDEGVGTTVRFVLPLRKPAAQAAAQA